MRRSRGMVVFLSVFLFIFNGCSTIATNRIPMMQDAGGQGRLRVSFYDTKGKMRDGVLTSHAMLLALYSDNPKRESARLISEGMGSVWRVEDLDPGKYYLKIRGWIDAHGNENTSKAHLYPVEIYPNQITEADIALTDYMKSSAAVGGAMLGTAAILTIGFSVALVFALLGAI